MTDEVETYTLRPEIEIWPGMVDEAHPDLPRHVEFRTMRPYDSAGRYETIVCMDEINFRELFVRVSEHRQQLREQIRFIVGPVFDAGNGYAKGLEGCAPLPTVDKAIDDIMAVVGLSNTPERNEQ